MSMSQCEFQILYHWSAFKVDLCRDEHHPERCFKRKGVALAGYAGTSSEDTAKQSIGVNGPMGPEVIVGRPSWAETVLVRCGGDDLTIAGWWFKMFLLVILGIWLLNYIKLTTIPVKASTSWPQPYQSAFEALKLRELSPGAESDYRSDRPTTARSAPIGARCASAELQDGCGDLVGHEGCDT